MTTRTVSGRLDGDGMRFVSLTGSGHTTVMDNDDGNTGPRPAELPAVALAGCTAMDVVSILRKKRQDFARYEVRVSGEQRDDPLPNVFERMRIVHVLEGNGEIDALRRAIELSATKHCTVTGNLASGVAEIHHSYVVRDGAGDEHYGEVVVTDPAERLDALGRGAPQRSSAGWSVNPTAQAVRPAGDDRWLWPAESGTPILIEEDHDPGRSKARIDR